MTDLLTVVKKGMYFCPAYKHYGQKTNVVCDRCNKQNLKACIGYENKDLCLKCVDSLLELEPVPPSMPPSIPPLIPQYPSYPSYPSIPPYLPQIPTIPHKTPVPPSHPPKKWALKSSNNVESVDKEVSGLKEIN